MRNPEVVAELKRIADEHGGQLRPLDVVDAARELTSPLHVHFEWEDSVAAERYRVNQARQLIRVTVEWIGNPNEAVSTRVFVSLSTDRDSKAGGYRATVDVLSDEAYRQQLLADAMEDMRRFQAKYRALTELMRVFDAMRAASDVAA